MPLLLKCWPFRPCLCIHAKYATREHSKFRLCRVPSTVQTMWGSPWGLDESVIGRLVGRFHALVSTFGAISIYTRVKEMKLDCSKASWPGGRPWGPCQKVPRSVLTGPILRLGAGASKYCRIMKPSSNNDILGITLTRIGLYDTLCLKSFSWAPGAYNQQHDRCSAQSIFESSSKKVCFSSLVTLGTYLCGPSWVRKYARLNLETRERRNCSRKVQWIYALSGKGFALKGQKRICSKLKGDLFVKLLFCFSFFCFFLLFQDARCGSRMVTRRLDYNFRHSSQLKNAFVTGQANSMLGWMEASACKIVQVMN